MAERISIRPSGLAVKIILITMLVFVAVFKTGDMVNWAEEKIENRKENRLMKQRQIAEAYALANPPREPRVVEFLLHPGYEAVVETGGNPFNYFFSGRADMELFRGEFASETLVFWNTSRERNLSRAQMEATQRVVFRRPRGADGPLGFMITIHELVTD